MSRGIYDNADTPRTVRVFRAIEKISQQTLADRCQVKRRTISFIETGNLNKVAYKQIDKVVGLILNKINGGNHGY